MSAFRLAGLLRIRATQEKLAAGDLARASADSRQARRLRDEARATLGAHELDAGGPAGWAGAVAARAALRRSLLDAQAEEVLAAERVAPAQRAWQDARARTGALERLAERHAEEQSRAALKEEQKLLDDIRGGTGEPGGPADGTGSDERGTQA